MKNIQFTVEEENLICIYHNADRRRTMTAIADALPYMDSDMQMMLINAFSDKELQEVIDDLYVDDTVDIIASPFLTTRSLYTLCSTPTATASPFVIVLNSFVIVIL